MLPVFAASMADNIPLNFLSVEGTCDIQKDWEGCGSHYLFFLAIFALICIPLSVGDLKEQLCVQVTMTFGRHCYSSPHCHSKVMVHCFLIVWSPSPHSRCGPHGCHCIDERNL